MSLCGPFLFKPPYQISAPRIIISPNPVHRSWDKNLINNIQLMSPVESSNATTAGPQHSCIVKVQDKDLKITFMNMIECHEIILLDIIKMCRSNWFNKTLIGQQLGRNLVRTTKLRMMGRRRAETELPVSLPFFFPNWKCSSGKRYQTTWKSIDRNIY